MTSHPPVLYCGLVLMDPAGFISWLLGYPRMLPRNLPVLASHRVTDSVADPLRILRRGKSALENFLLLLICSLSLLVQTPQWKA